MIFRDNISRGTALGKEAKGYIDRGELVPDSITIPMILDRIKEGDCRNGWLLDGFPRNLVQAQELDKALKKEKIRLDTVIEMVLDRQIAKNRIMGRRLCVKDNNHPNNIFIDAIKPNGDQCRVCGGDLKTRSDDQDEGAIDKRHGIYYDSKTGTVAAINYFKELSKKNKGNPKIVELDGGRASKKFRTNFSASLNESRWMDQGRIPGHQQITRLYLHAQGRDRGASHKAPGKDGRRA